MRSTMTTAEPMASTQSTMGFFFFCFSLRAILRRFLQVR